MKEHHPIQSPRPSPQPSKRQQRFLLGSILLALFLYRSVAIGRVSSSFLVSSWYSVNAWSQIGKAATNSTSRDGDNSLATGSFLNKTIDDNFNASDTSIIITSSLIPSHPNTDMIQTTVESLKNLIGLDVSTTPIYISVDGLKPRQRRNDRDALNRLAGYIENLQEIYKHSPNIQIVAHPTHFHIAGSINQMLVYVNTKYLYIVEHDFPFCREVDHTAVIHGISQHPSMPIVRFDCGLHPQCAKPMTCKAENMTESKAATVFENAQNSNTTMTSTPPPTWLEVPSSQNPSGSSPIHFYKSSCWSNNNHVTSTDYYRRLLNFIKDNNHYNQRNFLKHATEWLLSMHSSRDKCGWGQYVYYGQKDDGGDSYENHIHICHLDGREAYNDTVVITNASQTLDLECVMNRTCWNMTTRGKRH